jgi:hypothetical protein
MVKLYASRKSSDGTIPPTRLISLCFAAVGSMQLTKTTRYVWRGVDCQCRYIFSDATVSGNASRGLKGSTMRSNIQQQEAVAIVPIHPRSRNRFHTSRQTDL